jgi:hypothetical protein
MDEWTNQEGGARMVYAVLRIKDLRREAEDERLARTTAGTPAFAGLRRTVGRWLVGLGTGIAGSIDAGQRRVDTRREEEPWTA